MRWDAVADSLRSWHASRDPSAARQALAFVESELRLAVPPLVRRRWPKDLVEDALRAFLVVLLEHPLPDGIGNLRAYFCRAFRNHCIDLYRAESRRRETPFEKAPVGWDLPSDEASPAMVLEAQAQARELEGALRRMEITDRIALKLEHAPDWLSDDEVAWLGARLSRSPEDVRAMIAAAEDMHEFTKIFDPGEDDPYDPQARRKRMERFRRRRARAREKLHDLLRGVV